MRLKRWESPRRQGRNDKGKGGSARQRQLKKQQQMLRKKLKDNSNDQHQIKTRGGEIKNLSLSFLGLLFCREKLVNKNILKYRC